MPDTLISQLGWYSGNHHPIRQSQILLKKEETIYIQKGKTRLKPSETKNNKIKATTNQGNLQFRNHICHGRNTNTSPIPSRRSKFFKVTRVSELPMPRTFQKKIFEATLMFFSMRSYIYDKGSNSCYEISQSKFLKIGIQPLNRKPLNIQKTFPKQPVTKSPIQ